MMEYYLVIKKNEIMPFEGAWMDLEIIVLSEVNQKQKDKCHMISLTQRHFSLDHGKLKHPQLSSYWSVRFKIHKWQNTIHKSLAC